MVKFNKHLHFLNSIIFLHSISLQDWVKTLSHTDRFHQRPGDGGVHLEEQRHHQVRHHPRRRRHLPHHVVLQPQLLPQRTQARLPGSFLLLFVPLAVIPKTSGYEVTLQLVGRVKKERRDSNIGHEFLN